MIFTVFNSRRYELLRVFFFSQSKFVGYNEPLPAIKRANFFLDLSDSPGAKLLS